MCAENAPTGLSKRNGGAQKAMWGMLLNGKIWSAADRTDLQGAVRPRGTTKTAHAQRAKVEMANSINCPYVESAKNKKTSLQTQRFSAERPK